MISLSIRYPILIIDYSLGLRTGSLWDFTWFLMELQMCDALLIYDMSRIINDSHKHLPVICYTLLHHSSCFMPLLSYIELIITILAHYIAYAGIF